MLTCFHFCPRKRSVCSVLRGETLKIAFRRARVGLKMPLTVQLNINRSERGLTKSPPPPVIQSKNEKPTQSAAASQAHLLPLYDQCMVLCLFRVCGVSDISPVQRYCASDTGRLYGKKKRRHGPEHFADRNQLCQNKQLNINTRRDMDTAPKQA